MDELEHAQLIVILIDTKCEIQACIPSVYDFVVPKLQKVGHLAIPGDNLPMRFYFYSATLFLIVGDVPPAKPRFALSILEKDESDLQ
jgi:hypothetical protein